MQSSFVITNIFILLLLNYVQAFINLADVECGISKMRSRKIVNGTDANRAEFPWMASIKLRNRGKHNCGSAVINKNWVLTAAHCVENRTTSQFQVTVGQHSLNDGSSTGMTTFSVKEIIIHPSYVYRQKDDIALIKIDGNIEWSDSVQPICLPKSGDTSFSGRYATVSGWGWSDEVINGGYQYDTLQKVSVPILSNKDCQNFFKMEKKPLEIVDTFLCAGLEEGGKDSCRGDSGGPLMIEKDGHTLVVGVVNKGYGCALPRLPGLYARVTSYTDWILDNVETR